MKHAAAICALCLTMCGCVCIDGGRKAVTLRIQIESGSTASCGLYYHSGSMETECVKSNGEYVLHIPFRQWGENRFLGIVVERTTPDYIVVRRGGKTICRVTVDRLASSPVTANGAHLLKVK